MSWESFWTTMPNCSALAMKSPICWLARLRAIVCRLACRCCADNGKNIENREHQNDDHYSGYIEFHQRTKEPGQLFFHTHHLNCRIFAVFSSVVKIL